MTIAQEDLDGAKISLFFDPSYVGTTAVLDDEAYNVKQVLDAAGHTVTTFDGIDADDWRAATAGADVLMIPDLEGGSLVLSPGAQFLVRQFVSDGGTLIIFADESGNHADFLNAVFDKSFTPDGAEGTDFAPTVEVGGTVFEGGDDSLPNNNATTAMSGDFLRSLYADESGDAVLAAFQHGKGQIVWLGWDWYDAAPAPGEQNGGWNNTLDRAVSLTDSRSNGVRINGTDNDDKVKFDPVAKAFNSSSLDDVIRLKDGDDKASGGKGHDVIEGGKGDDELSGEASDDFLKGGKHNDKLWGNGGEDYFFFDQVGSNHADNVRDFVDGADFLVLKKSKFDDLTKGEMSEADFNQHIDYKANGKLFYDDKLFAKLQSGMLDIDHTDFLVT